MPNRIVWSQKALAQFRFTVRYWDLRNQSQSYSKRFKDLILRELNILLEFPNAFPESTPGTRKMTVDNFIILYTIKAESIVVIHFYDGRQNRPSH